MLCNGSIKVVSGFFVLLFFWEKMFRFLMASLLSQSVMQGMRLCHCKHVTVSLDDTVSGNFVCIL